MAVAFRSKTDNNTGSTPANNLVLSVPAGVQPGDTLLAFLTCDGNNTISTPAGWTQLVTVAQGTNQRATAFWRIADGTEPASYTFPVASSVQISGSMLAYSGAYPFKPSALGSNSNGTPATSLSPAVQNSNYIGLSVVFFGTRNTSAAATLTPGASFVERTDHCTTASPFLNAEVAEAAKAYPVGGSNANAGTSSQSATYCGIHVFLQENHGPAIGATGIQLDETPAGSRSAAGSLSFAIANVQTNYPNTLLLLCVELLVDAQTVVSVAGLGLTWALVGRANTNNGSVEIWRAFAANPITTPGPVTATLSSNTVTLGNISCMGFNGVGPSASNGADLIGAVAIANGASSAPTATLVTTRNNSLVVGAGNDNTTSGALSAPAGQTLIRTSAPAGGRGYMSNHNTPTPSSGTSVPTGTSTSFTNWNAIAVEILAQPQGGFFGMM